MDSKRREILKFILLNLVLLFITQPGSIAYANFNAPYGFMVDLTTWISSFIGLSLIAILYLHDRFGRKWALRYSLLILSLAYVVHLVQEPYFEPFRAPGYHLIFPGFLILSLLGALISLVLLPISIFQIKHLYLDYGYDLPLGVANLAILCLIIILSAVLYLRKEVD